MSVQNEIMMGMKIESMVTNQLSTTIITTGAKFIFAGDTLACFQRIPQERKILEVKSGGSVFNVERADDFTCVAASETMTMKIQGDSIVIMNPRAEVKVGFAGLFKPSYVQEKDGRRIFIDEQGGFGIYPVASKKSTNPDLQKNSWQIDYTLDKSDELWLSIFPPRPVNKRRLAEAIAHESISTDPYPSNEIIRSDAKYCKVFTMHAYFWKDVPEEIKPKTGKYAGRPCPWLTPKHVPADMKEFQRVQDEVRKQGMKLVVYLAPYYSTAPDILGEMKRVLDEYKVDGLYFDGVSMDFRKSYRIVRAAREILGDDRILYIHCSTDPLDSGRIYCPFIDTYADYILRGEGEGHWHGLALHDFLRWTISARNISNSVGYWCYYGSTGQSGYVNVLPAQEHIRAALDAGARIWRQTHSWSSVGLDVSQFDREYYGSLKSANR